MNYPDCIKWLDSLFEPSNWNLERMQAMVKDSNLCLGRLTAVQITGTNGKGSTCAYLESVLRHSGFKTGLYTSPHLLDIRERIRVNGTMVSKKKFASLVSWVKPIAVKCGASVFETLTLMAFKHFLDNKVDWAVVEVGLGGRLDATNVLLPKVSVVTNVELEHTDRLGNTVFSIALEKAGIIKHGQWACVTAAKGDALTVIRGKAKKCGVLLVDAGGFAKDGLFRKSGLKGKYQRQNLGIAIAVARVLSSHGVELRADSIVAGISFANWPGRFQKFGRVLVDGAHNPAGIRALLKSLDRTKKFSLVFGVLADKQFLTMASALCRFLKLRKVHLVRPNSPRALDPTKLAPFFARKKIPVYIEKSVKNALSNARGPVVVCGSLYVAADALRFLLSSARKGSIRLHQEKERRLQPVAKRNPLTPR